MALIRQDGIHHAKGVTPWSDVDKVVLWCNVDFPDEDVSVEIRSAGQEYWVHPPLHRTKTVVALVRRVVPADRVEVKDAVADNPSRYQYVRRLPDAFTLYRRWRLKRKLSFSDYFELVMVIFWVVLFMLLGIAALLEYLGSR